MNLTLYAWTCLRGGKTKFLNFCLYRGIRNKKLGKLKNFQVSVAFFGLSSYWSSELPITLRLKDGVYGEAGNNFSLRQSLFEHQTAPHFYDKIKSPAFLHIYYIQPLKLQIRVLKKAPVT